MGIFRILGLIGSASCMLLLAYSLYEFLFIEDRPVPSDDPLFWWVFLSILLTGFNLVPVTKSSESLIGLWIEAKKSELKKRIAD